MKEVREYTVQTFDEFSAEDQKKILDNYRNINTEDMDITTWDEYWVIGLRVRGFNVEAVDIDYDVSYCQGSGASFRCDSMDVGKLLADLDIKHKKFWIDYLKHYNIKIKDNNCRYCHAYSKVIDVDGDCRAEWYICEKDHPHAIKDYERIKEHIEQKRLDACKWLYKGICDEYDDLESDAAVRDTIEANEYMFDTRTLRIA